MQIEYIDPLCICWWTQSLVFMLWFGTSKDWLYARNCLIANIPIPDDFFSVHKELGKKSLDIQDAIKRNSDIFGLRAQALCGFDSISTDCPGIRQMSNNHELNQICISHQKKNSLFQENWRLKHILTFILSIKPPTYLSIHKATWSTSMYRLFPLQIE